MTFWPHRHLFTSLCAVIVAASACSKQGTSVTPAAPPVVNDKAAIHIGKKFKLFSKVLNEDRQYWVHLPQTSNPGRPTSTSYPVLYVLDGESRFEAAVATVNFLSGLAMIPEMVVVGVISTDQRMRDMTPTHSTKGRGASSGLALPIAGEEKLSRSSSKPS
jgi:enterochelin esterase-like enzyme